MMDATSIIITVANFLICVVVVRSAAGLERRLEITGKTIEKMLQSEDMLIMLSKHAEEDVGDIRKRLGLPPYEVE